jgi:hypothetical protein
LQSPGAVEASNVRLSIFLYAVVENSHLKNEGFQVTSVSERARSPLTVDLYYLLTTYAVENAADPTQAAADAQRNLANAMRVLHDHGVIAGARLRGTLGAIPEMALRVTLNAVTVEDMTRLWSVFPNKAYHLSVGYLVSPVPVPSTRVETTARVIDAETHIGFPAGGAT